MELVSVPAKHTYYRPARPFLAPEAAAPSVEEERPYGDLLDIGDVAGMRIIPTRLQRNVTIREENAATALEVMSRFAIDPRWLVYLPPTMSPSETSQREDLLEHPAEAFAYYRQQGVPEVVCEEKHMGSRAVIVVCRDEQTSRTRFGVGEGAGACYTRTGRSFFEDAALEEGLLDKVRGALDLAGMWEELDTDWICLDCEILSWSAKAVELLRGQYAAVGARRGREYLRIIYGPEYTAPGNLERLRSRRLGTKRSLAVREFALGVEALERFVRREPLYRVHECVFGVLALESEPVDPRL